MPFTPAQGMAAYQARITHMDAQLTMFTEAILRQVETGLDRRVKLAAQLLRDRIVVNISLPVVKANGVRSGRMQVIQRSLPGEYPRAETTRLMKDIFSNRVEPGWYRVGTSLDYGLLLETQMNRSYLRRTLNELWERLRRIMVHGTPGTADPPVFRLGDRQ